VQEAYAAGLLGRKCSDRNRLDLYSIGRRRRLHLPAGERLLESLEGKQGKPRFKPPFRQPLVCSDGDDRQQHAELRFGADDPAQGREVVCGFRRAHSGAR